MDIKELRTAKTRPIVMKKKKSVKKSLKHDKSIQQAPHPEIEPKEERVSILNSDQVTDKHEAKCTHINETRNSRMIESMVNTTVYHPQNSV